VNIHARTHVLALTLITQVFFTICFLIVLAMQSRAYHLAKHHWKTIQATPTWIHINSNNAIQGSMNVFVDVTYQQAQEMGYANEQVVALFRSCASGTLHLMFYNNDWKAVLCKPYDAFLARDLGLVVALIVGSWALFAYYSM
jgi:hypothetical protein